jgi:hypothetical protein
MSNHDYWKDTRIERFTAIQLYIGGAVGSHIIALTLVFTNAIDVLLTQKTCILSKLSR